MSNNFSTDEIYLEKESIQPSKDCNLTNTVRNKDETKATVISSFENVTSSVGDIPLSKTDISGTSTSQTTDESEEENDSFKIKAFGTSEDRLYGSIDDAPKGKPEAIPCSVTAQMVDKMIGIITSTIRKTTISEDAISIRSVLPICRSSDMSTSRTTSESKQKKVSSPIIFENTFFGITDIKMEDLDSTIEKVFAYLQSPIVEQSKLFNDDVDNTDKHLNFIFWNSYGRRYTEELVFAMDVMTVVGRLNHMPFDASKYSTTGDKPTSPCDETVKKAIEKIWAYMKDKTKRLFDERNFVQCSDVQLLILRLADDNEWQAYTDTRFLSYCVVLSELAVHAARIGFEKVPYFAPLVMCSTVKNIEKRGIFRSKFWQSIVETSNKTLRIQLGAL
ncbi:uncharacterized protein CEXT_433661 [Caerostris extrusa]|uniref:Uncharacterized protein n=1 Tax=Caerostris extrusa TaxID=172846 RepID=A0AAV4TP32_CAEEX|nr:uncharacterized protein CEXT_433661 [Caerostris extrusa]